MYVRSPHANQRLDMHVFALALPLFPKVIYNERRSGHNDQCVGSSPSERRMERFLSQPFLVAEVFTGKPGEITPLADTIRSFEEIADGKWDHLPEQAFMYVGAIEQAEEQAKKMAAKA